MNFKIKEKFNFPKDQDIYISNIVGGQFTMRNIEIMINEYLFDGKDNKFDIIDQKMSNLNKNNIYETLNLINKAIDSASNYINEGLANEANEHIRTIFNQALKRKSVLLEKVKYLIN
ncbi:MAG: hypothetical protein J6Y96_01830 [Mycoplasma sp.]|nr:hypothetical protein [Mycoplasma sp.]